MIDYRKFLIIGANGQLGQALQKKYPNAKAADIDELDITNSEAVKNYDWSSVKTILNAAAYTNVDGAETPEGRIAAWRDNAQAVANLVKIASENDLTIVHISTDYVFDGTKGPHSEDELFSPLNVYGASKAAGDIVLTTAPKHYLLRTSWVIGEGQNFVRTMLELGRKSVSPTVVADQIGRLAFTNELIRAIDHLLSISAEFGTYNISNGGEPSSWAEIARVIFAEAGFNLKVTDIMSAKYSANKPEAARRPLNSTLDLAKIEATAFKPTDWRTDLRQYIKRELSK